MTSGETILDVVREFFPGATDDEAMTILWARTGFPCFYSGDPTAHFRRQLEEYAEAAKRGTRLCDLCNNDAAEARLTCDSCSNALEAASRVRA